MTGTKALNKNVPSHYNPSTGETVHRFQKQQQQQQRKSELAAYDENVDDEDEENMSRFQNEREPPDGSKKSHQPQALFETSQNGKQERGEIKARQGWGHTVNTFQAQSKEHQPKHKKKDAKHEGDGMEQEVTDPITHLPVTQHDITSQELKHTLENIALTGSQQLPVGDVGERPQSKSQDKVTECEEPHADIERLFLPNHDLKTQFINTFRFAINVGMVVILLIMTLFLLLEQLLDVSKKLWISDEVGRRPWADALLAAITLEAVVLGLGVWGFRRWVENKVNNLWEEQVWKSETQSEKEKTSARTPESTQWLNSVLASVWPLVNPDLFRSMADTLEDSMQSSLPKLVNMISVEDLGQGSEAPRILGVRWLPSDATARSASASRKSHGEDTQENPQFEGPNSQQQDPKHGEYTKDEPQEKQEENLMKVVEAEEGDFVSLEVAFAYRAKPAVRNLGAKAKNAHLFLGIYLPAGLRLRKYFIFFLNFEFCIICLVPGEVQADDLFI